MHVSLVGRKGLTGEIYRQLRRAILDGRLPPGGRLPATLPADWRSIQSRWELFHTIRTFASIAAVIAVTISATIAAPNRPASNEAGPGGRAAPMGPRRRPV